MHLIASGWSGSDKAIVSPYIGLLTGMSEITLLAGEDPATGREPNLWAGAHVEEHVPLTNAKECLLDSRTETNVGQKPRMQLVKIWNIIANARAYCISALSNSHYNREEFGTRRHHLFSQLF